MSQPQGSSEVEFEKRRGISAVEVRTGFAQVHVSDLEDPVRTSRLAVLRLVAEAGISIDFLKLAPFGISFLIAESAVERLSRAFDGSGCKLSVSPGMVVLMVYAVNMRDEEGLVASIVSRAIGSGARIEHLGDMHDRLFIVSDSPGAKLIQDALQPAHQEASR